MASVTAGPAIETITAAMQADPGLWASSTYVSFSDAGGVEVSKHGCPFEDVTRLALLLGVDVVPYALNPLGEGFEDDSTVMVRFWNGADRHDGGIELKWFVNWHSAFDALGPNISALLPRS